jgi:hypothetical protein
MTAHSHMNTAPRSRHSAALHALSVVSAFAIVFTWLFAEPIITHRYLSDSDLYEYYLPIFLAPITTWSSFEFSGLPAFADPGDFTSYPPHFFFARIVGSWTGLIVSGFVLAAVFTYAYVYRLTRSRTAAAFAGLAYGMSEAMVERVAHLGTMHCFAWLPLILLAIEGVRGEHRRRWIAIGGMGVAAAFLSGHPQPAIYNVYVTALYALVGAIAERADRRYYTSVAAIYFVGGLLASIKAIPLVEASLLMARQEVNFNQFVSHANTPAQMLSILFPTILHEGREAPTYVGLATLALSFVGVSLARRSWRTAFWVGVAGIALLIGAGDATPVPRLIYAVVPLYQKFRVGARHLFLVAFAAAFLAGIGLAAIEQRRIDISRLRVAVAVLIALVMAGAAAQLLWPAAFEYEVRRIPPLTLRPWNTGIWVQLAIAAATCVVLLCVRPGKRFVVSAGVAIVMLMGDDLYSLPYPVTAAGLNFATIPAAAVTPDVHAVRLGRELEPLKQRALAFGGTQQDSVIPAAFARLWKIPIAGGYGPMLLERYARFASMGTNGSIRPGVLAPDDVSLDLAAVKYLFVQPEDLPTDATFERDRITWNSAELGFPIGRPDCAQRYRRTASIPVSPGLTVSAIALVSHLRCSEDVPQGTSVATFRLIGRDGVVDAKQLRAGDETGETGLAVPEILARAQHHVPAHVFDDPSGARGVRSFARLELSHPAELRRIDVETPSTGGWFTVDRLTIVDDSGHSHPVSVPATWLADETRWRKVDQFLTSRQTDRGSDETAPGESAYTVFENLRAQPRAWVTSDVKAIADTDALEVIHHSTLPDGTRFDPKETAIVSPDEGAAPAPFSPGASSASVERILDGHISVAVSTSSGGFLVLSELHYPGWHARIDGNVTPVRRTNVALQGVVVPPGRHTVEFELASTTQRAGAALSLAGLLVCVVLIGSDVRTRDQPAP